MAVIIDMPKLSDTMTVGTLVRWLKNEGDLIAPGDMIAEVETDKATMEVESFEKGILLKQYIKKGAQVPIGAPIGAVGEKGEEAPKTPSGTDTPSQESNNLKKSKSPKESQSKKEPKKDDKTTPTKETAVKAESSAASNSNGRIKASPLAKKMALDRNLSLNSIQGTGPGGRIVKADILALCSDSKRGTPSTPAVLFGKEESIPVSNIRQTIAKRLVESKTKVPHFYLDIEVNTLPLMQLRVDLNNNLVKLYPEQGEVKLTVNDFILKASADALKRVPAVNASWEGTSIKRHGSIHLSFGVSIDDELLTPVIRDAHAKNLQEISTEAKELIGKARNKKLIPNEMTGSTFTVTNLGMYGINNFFGIINPPNAGILSVGATIKKPIVDEFGSIVVGERMHIGFSGDHRVVNGAAGAEFLKALKAILETPALMLI